jgi:hypothetical protein
MRIFNKTVTSQINKLLFVTSVALTYIGSVAAHAGEQDYGNGMIWSEGGMMHNMGHMAGYNMWGPGWLGVLVGLLVWTLAVVGVYHLYKEYLKKEGGGE